MLKNIDAKTVLIAGLILLGIVGSRDMGYIALVQIAACLVFGILFELATAKAKKEPLFVPKSGMITSLIVSLIIAPNLPLYIPLGILFIALISKHILKFGYRHVFNPANFGLGIAGLFGVLESWWGASNIVLVAVLGAYLIYRIRRFYLAIAFILTHLILFLAYYKEYSPTFNAATIFFALIMLVEPITSPKKTRFGIFIGIFTAAAGFLIGLVSLKYHLVFSLAIANVVTFAVERWKGENAQKIIAVASSVFSVFLPSASVPAGKNV